MRALLFLFLTGAALAQEPAPGAPPAESIELPGVPPGPPPSPDQVDALTREIGSRLRCPVCQGLSVADSTSAAATQIYGRVRELVAAGYTQAQIEDFFVSRYDEWVLLDPRPSGMNLLVWVAPIAGFAFAGAIAASLSRKGAIDERERERDPDTVVDETAGGALPPDDPHARALLAEVDDA